MRVPAGKLAKLADPPAPLFKEVREVIFRKCEPGQTVKEWWMMVDQETSAKSDRKSMIARLRELIRAVDRRMPRPERTGESQIANEAATLKDKALARIAQLEMRARD